MCMCGNNGKGTGSVAYATRKCLQAGLHLASCSWPYRMDVLSNKDVSSHGASNQKLDSVDASDLGLGFPFFV